MDSLNAFSDMSGLKPSLPKSTAFFCNVHDQIKQAILAIMPFEEGNLPVRYLGVPLISSRLIYKDCQILVERLEKRISDRRNKYLSFAGRVQLIRSVLSSLHIYWASVFILPQRIIKELEAKMRGFLWSQGELIKGKAKVSWKSLCLPKSEGGLGIRRIVDVNKALMVNHIWRILNHGESLWVKWIHSYRLKARNFWDVPIPHNYSWGWRKMFLLRDYIRPHIWSRIGNGLNTSVWFDKWMDLCPIRNFISTREVMRAGYIMQSTVADLTQNGEWKWPVAWMDLFPVLISIPNIHVSFNVQDSLYWKDYEGKEHSFSSLAVWNTIRHKEEEIDWHKAIWFSQMIPRHAFLMWLIMKRKLKTQDIIMHWKGGTNMNYNLVCCPLCKQGPDSHTYLFFECSFSSQVWLNVRHLAQMQQVSPIWDDIFPWLLQRKNSRSAKSVIGRLLVAAATYFIWQERNARLFSNAVRAHDQIQDLIAATIRLKLVTLRFKNTAQVDRFVKAWNLPRNLVVFDHIGRLNS